MILLISGASHTGKTLLAQKLTERLGYPYLSIDHLKMGLIRSGQTALAADSPDSELIAYLWPITREIIKTAIENGQNLTVEGCYIPFGWKKDFGADYLKSIRHLWLVMDRDYIRGNWREIRAHANDIERRIDDSCLSRKELEADNEACLKGCVENGLAYVLIRNKYPGSLGIDDFGA